MEIKKKIYITITLFLIIDVLIGVFLLYPLYQDIREVSDNFLERRKEIVGLESKLRRLKELKKTYAEIEPDSKKIESLFVNSEKPIRFITFIERSADESGIEVNIAPGSGNRIKDKKWETVFFRIELSGTFPSFMKFLEKIEYSPWVVSIDNLNVRAVEKEKKEGEEENIREVKEVSASFQLKAYSKKNKENES